MTTMMKCGCAANGTNSKGEPVCVVHAALTPDAEVPVLAPDLEGRHARCGYYGGKCKSERPSSLALAFFQHRPAAPFDLYYCGCYGWE